MFTHFNMQQIYDLPLELRPYVCSCCLVEIKGALEGVLEFVVDLCRSVVLDLGTDEFDKLEVPISTTGLIVLVVDASVMSVLLVLVDVDVVWFTLVTSLGWL